MTILICGSSWYFFLHCHATSVIESHDHYWTNLSVDPTVIRSWLPLDLVVMSVSTESPFSSLDKVTGPIIMLTRRSYLSHMPRSIPFDTWREWDSIYTLVNSPEQHPHSLELRPASLSSVPWTERNKHTTCWAAWSPSEPQGTSPHFLGRWSPAWASSSSSSWVLWATAEQQKLCGITDGKAALAPATRLQTGDLNKQVTPKPSSSLRSINTDISPLPSFL